MFAAVGAGACDYELNASAAQTVTALFTAGLAIVARVFVDIVLWAVTWVVAALSPFVGGIEAGAGVGTTILATFLLEFADI